MSEQQQSEIKPEACLRCGGPMEAGFLREIGHNNRRGVARWLIGFPQRSWFFGVRTSEDNQDGLPVVGNRCKNCGLLHLHADARGEPR